ncbi:hypothetical protein SK128_026150, partial [Halocaridina rubra]
MDRRESFASCVTDSDVESTGGSYSDLSTGGISAKGDRSLLSTTSQSPARPSTPQSKNPFLKRSVAKRQAPQPPVRPPATTTPSSVTTVHLHLEPSTAPAVSNMPLEHTGKITKIVSEPVMLGHLIPPSSEERGRSPTVQRPIASHSPSFRAFSPDRPLSPPLQSVPTQTVGGFQMVENPSDVLMNNMSQSHPGSGRLPGMSAQALSPSRAKSPPPVSIPTAVPVPGPDSRVPLHSRPLSPPLNQSSRPLRNIILEDQIIQQQREEFLRPQSPPVQPIRSQRHSQRSGTLQNSPRNLSNLRIKLIDEESDSEAYQSDATEELRTPNIAYHTHYQYHFDPNDPSIAHETVVPVLRSGDGIGLGVSPEQYDYYSSFDESSQSEIGSEPTQSVELMTGEVVRGRPKRLIHSASDPGVVLPQRLLSSNVPEKQPRLPGLTQLSSLDQLSEEEDYDSEDRRQEDEIVGPGLKRTDSMVTVAHLYEDVLVSSRLRVRVTLTNLTVVVVVAALVLPNAAIMLYTAF